jgi:phenylalanine-4-hydroxylase
MSFSQEAVIASIPSHLRQFVVRQIYDEYTPQDHAVWRYVMRRNLDFLSKVAHPAYLSGLEKTGISLDYIPDIEDMNARLSKIGWKAVVVDGFVPPAAFMEFQAHKILVISAEIRNIKNLLYTPAPDIIHEAAGHAPIIADETYANYLQKIGEYGAKSVFSKLDYEIYEAIRQLSIIKEYPDAAPEQIESAERELDEKVAANTVPSESAYLARLHWWTVEYGLIGKTDDFKIYGAGILSSVGESKACLDPSVKKIQHSIKTAEVDYDITRMQPHLFVAASFQHLLDVLEEFADTMCFRKGGVESVRQVMASENVGTVVLDSGLQISGVISDIVVGGDKSIQFIRTSSQTSLAFNNKELEGHGITYHADGFSSPLGGVKDSDTLLQHMTDLELEAIGLLPGKISKIEFESGYTVEGIPGTILRIDEQIVLIPFTNCTVSDPQGKRVFEPEWGTFDMAVGNTVISAFSGSADKEKFNVYPNKSDKKAIKVIYSDKQKALFKLYQHIDDLRTGVSTTNGDTLDRLFQKLSAEHKNSWLILLELLELASLEGESVLVNKLKKNLAEIGATDPETNELIQTGIALYSA